MSSSGSTITIKFFEESDVECLVRGASTVDAQAMTEQSIRDFVSNQNTFLVLARTEEELVAMASGYFLTEIDGVRTVFLYEIDVALKYQRQGVATQIIEFLKEYAKAKGQSQMWVVASKTNKPAMALYKSTGATMANDTAVVWEYTL